MRKASGWLSVNPFSALPMPYQAGSV